jgi:hypothetical protein
MTKTWTSIRQELSRRLNEPVMRRIGTEISISGAIATNSFHSTSLGNLTNDWGVAYGSAYVSYTTDGLAPLGQELEIQSFRSDGSFGYAYTGSGGFSPALGVNDRVEIHEFFTVRQLLDATNQAIRDAWPAFYTITKDESIVLEKFKREYDLTTLAVRPRHLIGSYVEPIFRIGIGKATSAAAGTLVDTTGSFALESGKTYEIAIYYGTGAGQIRTVGTWTDLTKTFTVTPNWTVTPDATSEYMVKNMSDVYYNWLGPLAKVRLDQAEGPTLIEILYDTYELWGARLRLEYAAPVPELVGESSTLPDAMVDYVITRALYYLYMQNIGRTAQFDVKTAATLADQYDKQSEVLRDRNRMKRLDSTIRTDAQYMNWSDREMPFKR